GVLRDPAVVAIPLDWKSSSAPLHTSNPTAESERGKYCLLAS
ncbi:unnamed protein product, partial [Urochloa humidicola]